MSDYVIGIDLGTTNSALAYASVSDVTDYTLALPEVRLFHVPQLVNPGEMAELDLLPSSLYIPGETEFVEGSLALPWNERPEFVTGTLAQKRGVQNADPAQPGLPVAAPEGVPRISALEASRQYLLHLRSAWDAAHPEAKLETQSVLITVPASFDAAARELTQRAAKMAGYPQVTVIEEPQAAFYAWIERNATWREQVKPGDLILVVDIGGGTTDFTLISVTGQAEELQLERVAVGEHLLLGGDNMDLATARYAEQQFSQKGTKLDILQFHSLWQQCRAAKESLLSSTDSTPAKQPLTILGRGTGLVGGTIRGKISQDALRDLLVEGFFPVVASDAIPQRPRRAALLR